MRAQICLKISLRHSFRPVIILRGYNFFSRSSLKYWFFVHNFIERGRATRTCGDNNFFATKTLTCGTKTWPITISLHQNIHVRHENLAAYSGRPWTWPHANRTWTPSTDRTAIASWDYERKNLPRKIAKVSKIYQRPVQNTSNTWTTLEMCAVHVVLPASRKAAGD